MKLRNLLVIACAAAAVAAGVVYLQSRDNHPSGSHHLPTVAEQAAMIDKVKYQLEFQGFALAGTPWRDYHVGDGSGTDKVFVRVNDCAVPVVATVVHNGQGTTAPLKLQFTQPTKATGGVIPTVSYEVQPSVEQSMTLCPAAPDVSAMRAILHDLTVAGFTVNGGVYMGSNQDFGTTLQLPGCPLISQGQASDYRGTHVILTNADPRSNNVMLTGMPTTEQEVAEHQLCPVPGQ